MSHCLKPPSCRHSWGILTPEVNHHRHQPTPEPGLSLTPSGVRIRIDDVVVYMRAWWRRWASLCVYRAVAWCVDSRHSFVGTPPAPPHHPCSSPSCPPPMPRQCNNPRRCCVVASFVGIVLSPRASGPRHEQHRRVQLPSLLLIPHSPSIACPLLTMQINTRTTALQSTSQAAPSPASVRLQQSDLHSSHSPPSSITTALNTRTTSTSASAAVKGTFLHVGRLCIVLDTVVLLW